MSIEKDYDIYIAVCDICGGCQKSRWLAFTQRRAWGMD